MVRRLGLSGPLAIMALLIAGLTLGLYLRTASAQPTPPVDETPVSTASPTVTGEPTSSPTAIVEPTSSPTATAVPTPGPGEPEHVRHVTVTGTGVVTATANVAQIHATVEVTGTSATEVLSETNQLLQEVREAAVALGVSPSDIEGGSVSVFPNLPPGANQPSGYRATGSLLISVRDVDRAGAVLEAVTQTGAARASLFYALEPTEDLLNQARGAAFAAARRKAETLAQLAGGTLGQVIAVVEPPTFTPPIPFGVGQGAAGPDQPVPTFEPGAQRVEVALTVTFELQ